MKRIGLILFLVAFGVSTVAGETIYTKRRTNDVREGPGSYYSLIVSLPENTRLSVVQRSGSWVKIQLPRNKVGWIAANCLVAQPAGQNITRLENVWSSPRASKAGIAAAIKGFGEKYGKTDPGNVDKVLEYSDKGFTTHDLIVFNDMIRKYNSRNRGHVDLSDLDLGVPDYDVSLPERQIGVGIAARLVARGLLDNKDLHRYVNLICATITENSEIYDEDFTVFILDDAKVNAFALPGGYIFLTKGIVQLCRDEADLAGVIAHEIGHVVRRHGLAEISKRAANIAADKAFDELDQEVGQTDDEKDLEEMIESTYDKVLHPRLIQYELEADKVGAVLAANAGYDPFGLVRMCQRMASIPKDQGDIFDATFMAPNGFVERAEAIVKFANDEFRKTNPGATMQDRFNQYRIR
ncbi:MAG TPA: M48 family metalloprotease [Bacteroidota bacterium]|nr:M48 family metalloprotease [Bacteroidota bacterium]